MSEDESLQEYAVELSTMAIDALDYVAPASERVRIRNLLHSLSAFPKMGKIYDPDYPAYRTPFEMRFVLSEKYAFFYAPNDSERVVQILFIEDQRSDPLMRLSEK